MAALHLVAGEQALARCLARAAAGDTVVVFGALPPPADAVRPEAGKPCTLLWLRPDLGISTPLPGHIDYAGLVALTESHSPIVSWFSP